MNTEAFERARSAFVAGNEAFAARQWAQAEAHFLASLKELPGRPSTLVNLAATRLKLGRPAQALAPLREALAAQTEDGPAWHHLGTALLEVRQHEPALQALDRALALGVQPPAVHYRRGLALVELQRPEEAAQAWEQAVAGDPHFLAAWVDLGSLMRELGRADRARTCLERALALGAEEGLIRFQLAALESAGPADRPVPERPPQAYVEQLFDGYADGFDEHLVQRLGYCAPQVLADGLQRLSSGRLVHALDLGCGTGLCAAPLGPLVERLDGVDLSAGMLDKARALGRYTALAQADLVTHLQATPHRHDLVLAADVFIYVGALDAAFAGVTRCLRPGGWFCFSVEATGDEADFVLRSSLRYAHSARYLRHLAHIHGLEVRALERHPLRRDEREGVRGLYAWLQARFPAD